MIVEKHIKTEDYYDKTSYKNRCGICADACQEGAIGIVDGKAKLLRDDYCDGLGNCLPTCPTNAISFETREAAAFDEDAVKQNMQKAKEQEKSAFVCPEQARLFQRANFHNGRYKSNLYLSTHRILTMPIFLLRQIAVHTLTAIFTTSL